MHVSPQEHTHQVQEDYSRRRSAWHPGSMQLWEYGDQPAYLHSSGDILWNLVLFWGFFLTSQLETLVPTIHTFPAPGYCAIYQDSLLGTLSQVKGIDSDNQQAESSAFLAQAMLYHLDISIICMVYRVDKCAFPPLLWGHISIGSLSFCLCTCVSFSLPSLCPPCLYCWFMQDVFQSTKCSNTFITPG